MTEGFRTLFLATKPTWDGWLEALANNWVVAVRHDAVSGGKTWMHGMPEVIEVVKDGDSVSIREAAPGKVGADEATASRHQHQPIAPEPGV